MTTAGRDKRAAGAPRWPAVLLAVLLWAAPARGEVVTVEVKGAPPDISEAVTGAISIQPAGDVERIGQREARRLLRRGREQLEQAMRSFGYYRAGVEARLSGEPSSWQASYRVTPGQRLKYSEVELDITGPASSEQPLRDYLSSQPLAAGDPVRHERYEAVKQELLRRTVALGYLDARLTRHRVSINLEAYHADARVTLDSGPLYRFGDIRLHQEVLDDDFVKGFIAIERGDRYSDQRLLELEQDLRDSDYFSDIRVAPRLAELGGDGYVPVDVHVTPRDPSEYEAGAGFATDSGVRGSLAWQHRRLNERGHRVRGALRLSQIGGSAEARYTVPFGDPRLERYEVFASFSDDDPDTSDSELARIGALRATALGRTRLDLSLEYQREDFRVAGQSGLTDLFIPGVSVSRVEADNRLFTRNGRRWEASLQGSAGIISDFAFIQPRVSGKMIRSLGDARVILRGEAAWSAAELEDLPASLRFFAGGDQSVRGFGFETLGPDDDSGEVTGGRQLLVGSVEADYGIKDKWRLAGFVDAGNAFDEFEEPLRASAGIGIRRLTPIGPVRLDLAYPITSGGDTVRLHVTLGPDL